MVRSWRRVLLILGGGLSLVALILLGFTIMPVVDAATPAVMTPVIDSVPASALVSLPMPVSTPEPTPSVTKAAWAEALGNGLFLIPAMNFSAPLLSMPVTGGVVDPPTYTDAYLIEGYGAPRRSGTTYVAMHSGRGTDAIGNALIDIRAGSSIVTIGELLIVDAVDYRVTSVEMVDKVVVTDRPDLWRQVDGRLVVFTCLARPTGKSLQNVVITADRVP